MRLLRCIACSDLLTDNANHASSMASLLIPADQNERSAFTRHHRFTVRVTAGQLSVGSNTSNDIRSKCLPSARVIQNFLRPELNGEAENEIFFTCCNGQSSAIMSAVQHAPAVRIGKASWQCVESMNRHPFLPGHATRERTSNRRARQG